ncbi:MAG TPA: cation:proton antiporter [Crocinitomicaceae bacterium]|nr:cation:proton antiporter [Crocinitomicaceae bacterium]
MAHHLPDLIIDLALILAAGGVITLIFKKLKQPLVLGYILAGFLIGPHFDWLPTVQEEENINIWSEIGVIFLLFSLGLEFSFKKLGKVGGAASITALVEIIGVGAIGIFIGKMLGWETMDSIFLGGMLAMSSTTIIIRAFDELGLKTEKFVGVVFGTLIVEDLIAILMMVLLSTIATSSGATQNADIFQAILKLLFFLVLWFIAGIFFIPSMLKKTKKLMNDETLLIVSIALCLLMVVLAVEVGFSKELGAFIMGSILAETKQGEKIEHLVKPLKDLFGTIFFVSVGMLINPAMMIEYIVPILILTFVTIFVKGFFTSVGAFLSGQPIKTSIQTGMSMAQIGEFSFIIATLGLSLGVISEFLYPIAVAVSAITTLTTPYMIKASLPFYGWLDKKLPTKLKARLNKYTLNAQSASATKDWQQLIKVSLTNGIIYSVILLSIIIASSKFLQPFIYEQIKDEVITSIISALITLVAMSPFLWALVARSFKSDLRNRLLAQDKYKGLVYLVSLVKMVLAVFFVIFMLRIFFSDLVAFIATIVIFALLIQSRKRIQQFYNVIEDRFKTNLNAKELDEIKKQQEQQAQEMREDIAPWDTHIATIKIPTNSPIIGKKVKELLWRENVGVNIACIHRGEHNISIPNAEEFIFPYDELSLIGTDEQLAIVQNIISPKNHSSHVVDEQNVALQGMTIVEGSEFIGKTIRDSGIKTRVKGLVVGVERNNVRHLNPESDWILEKDDIVWIVGEKRKMKLLDRQ